MNLLNCFLSTVPSSILRECMLNHHFILRLVSVTLHRCKYCLIMGQMLPLKVQVVTLLSVWLARSESVPCVELLLRSGAKDQLSTAKGRMALYDAVRCGRIETAQLFLDQGVILERKEDLMHTAV